MFIVPELWLFYIQSIINLPPMSNAAFPVWSILYIPELPKSRTFFESSISSMENMKKKKQIHP